MIRLKIKADDRLVYNAAQHLATNGYWAVRIVPGEVELDSGAFMARIEAGKNFVLMGRAIDYNSKVPDIEKAVFGRWESIKDIYLQVTISGKAKFNPRSPRRQRTYAVEYAGEQERSVFLSEAYSDMVESFRGVVYAGPSLMNIVFVIKDEVPVFAVMPFNVE